jgi:hypothetical protein
MGNENGIQFFKWEIQTGHKAQRIVAGIEEQELTIDENGRAGLCSHLRNRTPRANQNGGDPVGALQFSCRFIGLILVVDDRAAEQVFIAAVLQKEYADGKNSNEYNCPADNEVSFIYDNLLF